MARSLLRWEGFVDFVQNLFTPPDRPKIWLSCIKTARKYSQMLFPQSYYLEGVWTIAIYYHCFSLS